MINEETRQGLSVTLLRLRWLDQDSKALMDSSHEATTSSSQKL